MRHSPTSTIAISKEDGKLIVVRKPVVQTWRERNGGCLVAILIFVAFLIFILVMNYLHILRTSGKEEADVFLITMSITAFIVFIVIIILVIRDILRKKKNVLPPDYNDEILTFDTGKFTAKKEGMVSSFLYRRDAKPMLCYNDHYGHGLSDNVIIVIPCEPLGDCVPYSSARGFYEMWSVDKSDAEHILTALKEHIGMNHTDE